MNYFFDVLKKYAVFTGRARRSEFWYFQLFTFIISTVLTFSISFIDSEIGVAVSFIFSLAIFLPRISVSARRMHDVGRSGWYMLIPIYSIILFATDGNKGQNEYGTDPKGNEGFSGETLDSHLIK